ncbi:M23 family metallopeptidase [Lacibacterium aquatile]|uniref:M23 family metallopeptidase n=1 Tax=Lacibacterium aquatile TaxID=1168082 RepID=A0ABW5DYW4_9PROT
MTFSPCRLPLVLATTVACLLPLTTQATPTARHSNRNAPVVHQIPDLPKGFIVPVKGGRMTSGFGWRVHPILKDVRFHNGVDFAVARGTPVVAAKEGTIVSVSWHKTYGRLVRIRHADGYETVYAHLNSFAPGLVAGKKVRQGQQIGSVGTSGYATGPHLYWEVYLHGEAQDPLELVAEADVFRAD